jgi:hypothetical protein
MYIIRIFSPFATSSKCKEVYETINNLLKNKNYGPDKSFYITEGEKYTHAIIINTCMPVLTVPKENVIGLAFEPVELLKVSKLFIIYARECIGKYFIGTKNDLPSPFKEHFGYMWHSNPHKSLTYKPNIMSICVSEKQYAPGHKYRHLLISEIIKRNLPIDIYGRGSHLYSGSQVKGAFNDTEPYEQYLFSICIENFQNNDYISEKFITPLLHNCMPIYLGAHNINKYFNNDALLLTNNIDNDIKIIINILENPYKYYKQTYTKQNMDMVNFTNQLDTLFK